MKKSLVSMAALVLGAAAAPGVAQDSTPATAAPAPTMATAPKLLVVISVDQFSADLFAEIGRESSRERVSQYVWISVVSVPLKKITSKITHRRDIFVTTY